MSNRIGMICNLKQQEQKKNYTFEKIKMDDLEDMSAMMFEAFQNTDDYDGETIEELKEELNSVMCSTFGSFLPEASFQIRQNNDLAAVILISFYKGRPFISELFTSKKYLKLGMASALLKQSINSLLNLGYEDLVLHVHPQNEGAIILYKKIGFVESKEV